MVYTGQNEDDETARKRQGIIKMQNKNINEI
jgi:hypothetical protein